MQIINMLKNFYEENKQTKTTQHWFILVKAQFMFSTHHIQASQRP